METFETDVHAQRVAYGLITSAHSDLAMLVAAELYLVATEPRLVDASGNPTHPDVPSARRVSSGWEGYDPLSAGSNLIGRALSVIVRRVSGDAFYAGRRYEAARDAIGLLMRGELAGLPRGAVPPELFGDVPDPARVSHRAELRDIRTVCAALLGDAPPRAVDLEVAARVFSMFMVYPRALDDGLNEGRYDDQISALVNYAGARGIFIRAYTGIPGAVAQVYKALRLAAAGIAADKALLPRAGPKSADDEAIRVLLAPPGRCRLPPADLASMAFYYCRDGGVPAIPSRHAPPMITFLGGTWKIALDCLQDTRTSPSAWKAALALDLANTANGSRSAARGWLNVVRGWFGRAHRRLGGTPAAFGYASTLLRLARYSREEMAVYVATLRHLGACGFAEELVRQLPTTLAAVAAISPLYEVHPDTAAKETAMGAAVAGCLSRDADEEIQAASSELRWALEQWAHQAKPGV